MILNDCFNCLGLAKTSAKPFHPNGVLKCWNDISSRKFESLPEQVHLFGKYYSHKDVIDNIADIFDLSRKSLMLLHSKSTERGMKSTDKDFTLKLRNDISTFLNFILLYLKSNDKPSDVIIVLEDHLHRLRLLFHRLSFARLPDHTLAYYASTFGNNMAQLATNLIHCHLDFRWLYINIIHKLEEQQSAKIGCTQTQAGKPSICSEEEIMHLINELIWLAIVRYEKADKNDISSFSAYPCMCIKELWLLLMHFPYPNQNFWTYFNQLMRVVLDGKMNPSDFTPNSFKIESADFLPCSNRNEFAIWFIADISRLVEFDRNGCHIGPIKSACEGLDMVDDILRQMLLEGDDPSEQAMRNVLPLICRIQSASGHSRSAPILLLAEYFFKKINSTFYIPGSKINSNVVLSKTAQGLFNDVKSRLSGGFSRDKRENSFYMFLRLLGEHLKYNSQNNISSSRLCSRVFLKFPSNRPEKYSEFLECGIFHIIILYLTLGLGSRTANIVHRLLDLLVTIPKANGMKEAKHEMIWKGYGASLLVLAELRADLSDASALILQHVQWCLSQPCLTPLTHFLDALSLLFEQDVAATKGIHCFIAPWIESYISVCRKSDKARVQSLCISLLQKLIDSPGTSESQSLKGKAELFIVPILTHDASLLSAELAALCALNANKHRAEIFRHWGNHPNFELAGIFLATILERGDSDAHVAFPELSLCVKQVWTRCCFVWGNTSPVIILSQCISQMDLSPSLNLNPSSPSLFKTFLEHFNHEYAACQTIFEKSSLRTLFTSFFPKFDAMLMSKCEEFEKLDANIVDRFYDYAAEMVGMCPQLIYTKSDPRCLFKAIVDSLVLPRAVYKPEQRMPQAVIAALALTLPRFIQGFFALSPENDPYTGRILRDTITLYLPRLRNVPLDNHPITVLLNNRDHALPTLNALNNLLTCRDQILLSAILNILKPLTASDIRLSTDIFDTCSKTLITEMIGLDPSHPLQNILLDFFRVALESARNRERLMTILSENCSKILPRNPNGWFNAATKLAPLCRLEHARLQSIATEVVTCLENQRGGEKDAGLRRMLNILDLASGNA